MPVLGGGALSFPACARPTTTIYLHRRTLRRNGAESKESAAATNEAYLRNAASYVGGDRLMDTENEAVMMEWEVFEAKKKGAETWEAIVHLAGVCLRPARWCDLG